MILKMIVLFRWTHERVEQMGYRRGRGSGGGGEDGEQWRGGEGGNYLLQQCSNPYFHSVFPSCCFASRKGKFE